MNSAPRHMNSKKKCTVIFYTFKNYFITVFSIFNFNNIKIFLKFLESSWTHSYM